VAGFCEHGNEPSGSIQKEGDNLFDKLSNYQRFKEYPAPRSLLFRRFVGSTEENDEGFSQDISLRKGK
jgi:hypothetical protein